VSPAISQRAASLLSDRQAFAHSHNLTFYDPITGAYRRDLFAQLGYAPHAFLKFVHYLARYERGGIAERIVDAYPDATWSAGARVVEDPDPSTETTFESAVRELFNRLGVWSRFLRADRLCGLGRYAVLLIGAKGDFASELPENLGPDGISYLTPLPEVRAEVETYYDRREDRHNPLYGQPRLYKCRLGAPSRDGSMVNGAAGTESVSVHHTRILHIADGLLDNEIFGRPRLRAVWNYLDDLDKVIGGGAEAAWKRMDPGMQVNVDPEMPFPPAEQAALKDEITEYLNGLRRVIRTRGTDVNLLSTTVAGFGPNADSIIKVISATTGIPYRILTGSEMGQLASAQDRLNWADRITERRRTFATRLIRDFVTRLVTHGALPAPAEKDATQKGKGAVPIADGGDDFTILWPEVGDIDNVTKADIIGKIAAANQALFIAGQPPIMTPDEMRRVFLALGPMKEEDIPPTKYELEREKLDATLKLKEQQAPTGQPTGPDPDTPSPSGEGGPDA
jgi:hypothetical protein